MSGHQDADQERFEREVSIQQGLKIGALEGEVARLTAEVKLLYLKIETVRDELCELKRARR